MTDDPLEVKAVTPQVEDEAPDFGDIAPENGTAVHAHEVS